MTATIAPFEFTDRKQVHVKIRHTSHANLYRFARQNGVTVAALIDALSEQLHADSDTLKLGRAIAVARNISAERRAR